MINQQICRRVFTLIGVFAITVAGHAGNSLSLIEGASGLANFDQIGGGNWRTEGNFIEIDSGGDGPSYLVTKDSYDNFSLDVEFWSSDDANSGIFMRCQDRQKIDDKSCYEANIFDQRPDQSYATGGIVNIAAAPDPLLKAGGKWNRYQITLDGSDLLVILNGETTANVSDSTLTSGYIALQWGQGVMRFRKFELTPISE